MTDDPKRALRSPVPRLMLALLPGLCLLPDSTAGAEPKKEPEPAPPPPSYFGGNRRARLRDKALARRRRG